MTTLLALVLFLSASNSVAGLTGPAVQGPTTSTLLAVPLWNSTDGTVLQDSTLLYDGTSVSGGLTATFKPTVSGTSKTYGAPNISGNFLVNAASDTFNTTFMGEGLTWFNNSDTSKRFVFNLSTEATGKTVTLNMTSPLAGTAGSTGTINFPSFPTGVGTLTLMATTGRLNSASVGNYLDFVDEAANLPIGPATGGIRILNNGENIDYINSDSKLMHGTGFLRTDVDFGSTPLTEKSFTITDSESETTNTAVLGLANSVDAFIPRAVMTGKTYIDESDMDSFFVSCSPGAGAVTCLVRCLTGQFSGHVFIDYRIKAQVQVN